MNSTKPPKYSYDEECERLARHFLTDEPGATETGICDLAQFIQENIESWIAQTQHRAQPDRRERGMLRDTRTLESRCPYCGYKLNGAMAGDPKEPDATPSAGDLSVCISCASVLVFNADLTVRKPLPGEVAAAFAADPEFAEAVRHAQRAVRQIDRRSMS